MGDSCTQSSLKLAMAGLSSKVSETIGTIEAQKAYNRNSIEEAKRAIRDAREQAVAKLHTISDSLVNDVVKLCDQQTIEYDDNIKCAQKLQEEMEIVYQEALTQSDQKHLAETERILRKKSKTIVCTTAERGVTFIPQWSDLSKEDIGIIVNQTVPITPTSTRSNLPRLSASTRPRYTSQKNTDSAVTLNGQRNESGATASGNTKKPSLMPNSSFPPRPLTKSTLSKLQPPKVESPVDALSDSITSVSESEVDMIERATEAWNLLTEPMDDTKDIDRTVSSTATVSQQNGGIITQASSSSVASAVNKAPVGAQSVPVAKISFASLPLSQKSDRPKMKVKFEDNQQNKSADKNMSRACVALRLLANTPVSTAKAASSQQPISSASGSKNPLPQPLSVIPNIQEIALPPSPVECFSSQSSMCRKSSTASTVLSPKDEPWPDQNLTVSASKSTESKSAPAWPAPKCFDWPAPAKVSTPAAKFTSAKPRKPVTAANTAVGDSGWMKPGAGAVSTNSHRASSISKFLASNEKGKMTAKKRATLKGENLGLSFPIGSCEFAGGLIVCNSGDNTTVWLKYSGNEIVELKYLQGNFKRPSAAVVDKTNNLFLKDDIAIFKYNSALELLNIFGKEVLNRPYGLAVTKDNHIITMFGGGSGRDLPLKPRLVTFDIHGYVIANIKMTLPLQSKTKLRFMDTHDNTVYISDLGASYVYSVNLKTGQLNSIIAGGGIGDGEFREPSGITVDGDGNILIADSKANRIQIFDNTGKFRTFLDCEGLVRPSGIYLSPDDILHIVNYLGHKVQVYDLMNMPMKGAKPCPW